MSYLKYFKKGVLTSTLYYPKTNGIIRRYKTVSDSSVNSYITFVNLNSSKSYGLEFIIKQDITKWWNTTLSAYLFQTVINANNIKAELQNENACYLFILISNTRIIKNLDIQFAANFNGPTARAQGLVKQIFSMDLGIKKEIFKNAILSFKISDITDTHKMQITANDNNFYQEMSRKRVSRIATINFTYRIGKFTENKRARQEKFSGGGAEEMGM